MEIGTDIQPDSKSASIHLNKQSQTGPANRKPFSTDLQTKINWT